MNHQDLVDNLESTLTTFTVAYGALLIAFGEHPEDFGRIKTNLSIDISTVASLPIAQRVEIHTNATAMLLRSTIAATHETILDYVKNTQQKGIYESQQWYGFLIVLRHASSHANGIAGNLNYWPPKLSTPVTWRHRKIDSSIVGREIAFSAAECVLLLQDIIVFVHDVLQ